MLPYARVEAPADYHGAARQYVTYETPIVQDQFDNLNPLNGKTRAECGHVDVTPASLERFHPLTNLVDTSLSSLNGREASSDTER